MSAEKLAVTISPSNASFAGAFAFAGEPPPRIDMVRLQIPIWLPDESSGDASVAAFWGALKKGPAEGRESFEHLTGIQASIEGHPLYLDAVITYTPENYFLTVLRPEKNEVFAEPGFRCVLADFGFAPWQFHLTAGAAIRATVSYHHLLCNREGESRFFYVPFFLNRPKNAEARDTKRYGIAVTCAAGNPLRVLNGEQAFRLGSGETVTLSPVHCQPIRASLKPGA